MTTLPPPAPSTGKADRVSAALWTNRSKKGKAGVIVGGLVAVSLIAGPFLPAEEDDGPVAVETAEAPEVTEAPVVAEATVVPVVVETTEASTTTAAPVVTAAQTTAPAPVVTATPTTAAAPVVTAAPTTTAAPVVTAPPLTIGQKNAVGSAESYLDFTAFSRQGLIDQLVYEEFSVVDATFAVDFVNPDWLEQAEKSAQQYLDFSSFSRQGLIDQLIFEGFSPEQAEFGVVAVGY